MGEESMGVDAMGGPGRATVGPSKGRWGRGELRHGVLGSSDAVAQSLALLALAFGVSAAPASAAATAGAAVPWAYFIAGVGSLCLAAVIVRFTRRIAHAGGLYTYTVRGLGPRTGFLAGWMYGTAYAIGISFVLIISADFLSVVLTSNTAVHLGWFPIYCILLGVILVLALVDIRVSTRVQLVFAVVGVLTILVLALVIVAKGGAHGITWRPLDPTLAPSTHGLFLAVVLAFTGFIGFEAAAVLGEEAAEPLRVIPRAILATVLVAMVYYVFVTWAMSIGYGVAGAGKWAADPTALSTLSDHYVAHWFSTFVDVVVAIDAFVAALAGVQLTARTLFAMGRDRGIPSVFASTTPRFKSPWVGISAGVVLTFILGVTLGRHYGVFTYFALMATTGSLGILFVYASGVVGNGLFLEDPSPSSRVVQRLARCGAPGRRHRDLRLHHLFNDSPGATCAYQLCDLDRARTARLRRSDRRRSCSDSSRAGRPVWRCFRGRVPSRGHTGRRSRNGAFEWAEVLMRSQLGWRARSMWRHAAHLGREC